MAATAFAYAGGVEFPRTIVRVEVRADDIILGTPCDDVCCPIGLALQRVLIDGLKPGIQDEDIIFWGVAGYPDEQPDLDPALWAVELPDVARQFVADLDNQFEAGDPITVRPFKFELSLPPQYVRGAA